MTRGTHHARSGCACGRELRSSGRALEFYYFVLHCVRSVFEAQAQPRVKSSHLPPYPPASRCDRVKGNGLGTAIDRGAFQVLVAWSENKRESALRERYAGRAHRFLSTTWCRGAAAGAPPRPPGSCDSAAMAHGPKRARSIRKKHTLTRAKTSVTWHEKDVALAKTKNLTAAILYLSRQARHRFGLARASTKN